MAENPIWIIPVVSSMAKGEGEGIVA